MLPNTRRKWIEISRSRLQDDSSFGKVQSSAFHGPWTREESNSKLVTDENIDCNSVTVWKQDGQGPACDRSRREAHHDIWWLHDIQRDETIAKERTLLEFRCKFLLHHWLLPRQPLHSIRILPTPDSWDEDTVDATNSYYVDRCDPNLLHLNSQNCQWCRSEW